MKQPKILLAKIFIKLIEFLIKREKHPGHIKVYKHDLMIMNEVIKPEHERDEVMIYLDSLGIKK